MSDENWYQKLCIYGHLPKVWRVERIDGTIPLVIYDHTKHRDLDSIRKSVLGLGWINLKALVPSDFVEPSYLTVKIDLTNSAVDGQLVAVTIKPTVSAYELYSSHRTDLHEGDFDHYSDFLKWSKYQKNLCRYKQWFTDLYKGYHAKKLGLEAEDFDKKIYVGPTNGKWTEEYYSKWVRESMIPPKPLTKKQYEGLKDSRDRAHHAGKYAMKERTRSPTEYELICRQIEREVVGYKGPSKPEDLATEHLFKLMGFKLDMSVEENIEKVERVRELKRERLTYGVIAEHIKIVGDDVGPDYSCLCDLRDSEKKCMATMSLDELEIKWYDTARLHYRRKYLSNHEVFHKRERADLAEFYEDMWKTERGKELILERVEPKSGSCGYICRHAPKNGYCGFGCVDCRWDLIYTKETLGLRDLVNKYGPSLSVVENTKGLPIRPKSMSEFGMVKIKPKKVVRSMEKADEIDKKLSKKVLDDSDDDDVDEGVDDDLEEEVVDERASWLDSQRKMETLTYNQLQIKDLRRQQQEIILNGVYYDTPLNDTPEGRKDLADQLEVDIQKLVQLGDQEEKPAKLHKIDETIYDCTAFIVKYYNDCNDCTTNAPDFINYYHKRDNPQDYGLTPMLYHAFCHSHPSCMSVQEILAFATRQIRRQSLLGLPLILFLDQYPDLLEDLV